MCNSSNFRKLYYRKTSKKFKYNKGHFYQIIVLITIFLSDFLTLIPYFIKKCIVNNQTKAITGEDKSTLRINEDYIYTNIYDEEKRKKSKK